MIDDILDYIDSYDNARIVLGVPEEELTDAALGLIIFRNHLNSALLGITGTYPLLDANGDRSLIDIYADISDDDDMHGVIQSFAIYSVADCAAKSLPMFAYKTKADGKSTLTRHSSESVYEDTQVAIKNALSGLVGKIRTLFGETIEEIDLITAVAPDVDIVTGE